MYFQPPTEPHLRIQFIIKFKLTTSHPIITIQSNRMDRRKGATLNQSAILLARKGPTNTSANFMNKMISRLKQSGRKNHSRNTSSAKKSRSKSKGKVDKNLLLFQYGTHKNKNKKQVAFIPQTIKFKEKTRIADSRLLKSRKGKYQSRGHDDKQNSMFMNNFEEKLIPNRDLLRTSLKPSKINFMSRVSQVYDLVISNGILPQFIQYFLGEALYAIRPSKNETLVAHQVYDWKLDQFKHLCQKIYDCSSQEDLKYFLGLSLPSINRWDSRPNSTKMGSSLLTNCFFTANTDSRVTVSTNSRNRIEYFKSLNKRERPQLGDDERQSVDILDKLNLKLDNYLKSNYEKDQLRRTREISEVYDLPLQAKIFERPKNELI